MTFLSKISNFINKQFESIRTERAVTQTRIPYDDVGIFNASLAEQDEALYSYTPENPPTEDNIPLKTTVNNESVTSNKSGKTKPMTFEKPESIVQVPVEESEVPDETECFDEYEDVTVEENVETGPYVQGKNENIHIEIMEQGKDVSFTYNVASIEDYITHNSYKGYFKRIPEIRAKAPEDRTEDETKLLQEFDNMVEYIVNAGVEYGVDPNFIAAIIQKEVGFSGLRKGVTGVNGKGHMQLTTIAIEDMLLFPDKYGPEITELMASRGFDLNCPASQRKNMVKKIIKYLKDNKDPEFNIRVGTIKLRRLLKASKGNFSLAAYNYNGNKAKDVNQPTREVRDIYREKVTKYYKQLQNHQV